MRHDEFCSSCRTFVYDYPGNVWRGGGRDEDYPIRMAFIALKATLFSAGISSSVTEKNIR